MVNIDQRETAAYNAGDAAGAGVDRPTALSWLGLFRMWMGLQPIRSAFRRGLQRDASSSCGEVTQDAQSRDLSVTQLSSLALLVQLLLIMPVRNRLNRLDLTKENVFLFSPGLTSLVQKCEVKCLRYGIGPLVG